jgi:large subunit ribosomal protein L20
MARVKRGTTSHARHKETLKLAKGYYGRRKSCIRTAKQAVEKAMQYAYRDRRNKKRDFRGLWIQRINAATRAGGLSYSQFMYGMKLAGLDLNRKMLSELAIHDEAAFTALIEQVQKALPVQTKAAA